MDLPAVDIDMPAPTVAQPVQSRFVELLETTGVWLYQFIESSTNAASQDLANRCLRVLGGLPADFAMRCFNRNVSLTTTLCLEFLGNSWMRDEHINAGFDVIAQQLGPNSRVAFQFCWHLDVLHGFRHGHDGSLDPSRPYNPKLPRYGDKAICLGSVDRVFIPAFVNGNHWTLVIVDCRNHTLSYFDPMHRNALAPAEKLSDLRWWLDGLLPGHLWPVVPTPVVSQLQTDSSSCGIVVLSAVASLLLGYPTWVQTAWRESRMEWFLRVTEFWLADQLVSRMNELNV